MYTILYTKSDGNDGWERFESAAELLDFLTRNNLLDDGDLQIYGPEIDNFLLSVEEITAAVGKEA